jgi:hypothetical protein
VGNAETMGRSVSLSISRFVPLALSHSAITDKPHARIYLGQKCVRRVSGRQYIDCIQGENKRKRETKSIKKVGENKKEKRADHKYRFCSG